MISLLTARPRRRWCAAWAVSHRHASPAAWGREYQPAASDVADRPPAPWPGRTVWSGHRMSLREASRPESAAVAAELGARSPMAQPAWPPRGADPAGERFPARAARFHASVRSLHAPDHWHRDPERCDASTGGAVFGAATTGSTTGVTGCAGMVLATALSRSRGLAGRRRVSAGMLAVSAGFSADFSTGLSATDFSAFSTADLSMTDFSEIPFALTPGSGVLPRSAFFGKVDDTAAAPSAPPAWS